MNTYKNKQAADRTKLFLDGKPCILTSDDFIAQVTALKEAREEKLNKKAACAALRVVNLAEKDTAKAAWKLMMVEHNDVVTEWKATYGQLRAQTMKLKDSVRKHKRHTKPKHVIEVKSESDGNEEGSKSEV